MRSDAGGVGPDSRGGFRASITRDGVRTQPRGASVEAVTIRLHAVERDSELEAVEAQREVLHAASWSVAAEVWLATAGHAPATREGYRKRIRSLARLAPWWSTPITSTNPIELQRLLDGLRTRTGTPASASIRRGCLAVLRGTVSIALRHPEFGLLSDPTASLHITGASEESTSTLSLSSSEAYRVLEAAAVHSSGLRWLLGLHLGVRPSELLALEDDDLIEEGGTLLIRVRATLVRLPSTATTPTTWARQTTAAERVIPVEPDSQIGQAITAHREALAARRRAQPAPTAKQAREQQAQTLAFGRAVRAGAFGPAELRLPTGLLFPHPADVTRPTPDDRDAAAWRALLADAGVDYRPRSAARLYAEHRLLEQLADDAVAAAILGTTPATLLRRHPGVLSDRLRSAMRRMQSNEK